MGRYASLLILVAVVMLSGCVAKSDLVAKVAELDGVKKDLTGVEAKLKSAEQSLADEKAKTAELEKQKADLEQEKAALQKENANIKSTLESSRSQLTKDVVELKNRVGALDQELAGKNKHIMDLKELVDQLSREKAQAIEEKERAIAGVKNTYDSLVSELKQEIKQGEVQITQLRDKLTVNMVEKILFDSGSAVIKKDGKKVLDRVADILKNLKNQQIKVEGHTDNVPISTRLADKFPTNWELATARATTVVRYLQERGVSPEFLGAEGYAEFRPVAPNDTDENKSRNRRIEIVLVPMNAGK